MEGRPMHTAQSTRVRRLVVMALLLSLGAAVAPRPASAEEEYDPKKAGHPLRIVAYVAHPAGVLVDYLILRPAYYIGRIEPFRTIFGVTNP
jgi:hypothetical protein